MRATETARVQNAVTIASPSASHSQALAAALRHPEIVDLKHPKR